MIKDKTYLISVDQYNKPEVITDKEAIGIQLYRLILLEPGSDPLHPEMGVGIRRFRYTMDTLENLKTRIEDQLERFLPCYPEAKVTLYITSDRLCNINIDIDDVTFVYDSSTAEYPIEIGDLTN